LAELAWREQAHAIAWLAQPALRP